MIRRPPRSTLDRSSAGSDVYKRQVVLSPMRQGGGANPHVLTGRDGGFELADLPVGDLSLIHISEPTRPY